MSSSPNSGDIQLDVNRQEPYNILTWSIDRTEGAPSMGLSMLQRWPYAPYQEMVMALRYGRADALLFLCLAALTLLLCRQGLPLGRLALLGGLFLLPYWLLMTGGMPLTALVSPTQFAAAQVKLLPALALLPLALSVFILRDKPWPVIVLMTALMGLLILGHPLLELQTDAAKREAALHAVQTGLVIYPFAIALLAGAFSLLQKKWPLGKNDGL